MPNTPAEWYYARNGAQTGPLELDAVRAMLAGGQLNSQDLVWREGMASWTAIAQVPAFQPGDVAAPQAATASPVPDPGFAAPNYPAQPQAYAQPGYASAPIGYNTPTRAGESQKGMAIAGFVMAVIPTFPLPLVGFIISMIALKAMKRTGNDEGKGLATAGAIVGGILTGLVCVGVLIWVLIIAAFVGSAAAGGH